MDKDTAYHEWLGIPKSKHPPNHYVLLSIPEFERSKTVIENAAARNIFFLQRFFSSPFAELAQQIQKEVAEAKKFLCDPDRKEEYDIELATMINLVESKTSTDIASQPGKSSVKSSFATVLATTANTTEVKSIRDIIDDGIQSSIMLAEKKNWLIGWDPGKCDIIVDNKFVSAKHCILFCEDGEFEIEDLNSTNGTFVNGEKLSPRRRYPVRQKDDITLGRKTIMPWPPIE